jgi:hypothetical protein
LVQNFSPTLFGIATTTTTTTRESSTTQKGLVITYFLLFLSFG